MRFIRFKRIVLTDITFFEEIFLVDIFHLILMTCNYLHFIRIFSLFLSFILLEFYPYRFGVTIWFTIHIGIIHINTFIILMPTLPQLWFSLEMEVRSKSRWLSISHFLFYWSLSMLLIGLPFGLWISSLFLSGLVYIGVSCFAVYVSIIHAKWALVIVSVVWCIYRMRICCSFFLVYIEN